MNFVLKYAFTWCSFCLKYFKMLCRASPINHLHAIYSYYEGQLTPFSEIDVEDEMQAPRIRVTEAAERVC
jgi:hypothetical protein